MSNFKKGDFICCEVSCSVLEHRWGKELTHFKKTELETQAERAHSKGQISGLGFA